jgi:hypothetical protein
MFYEALVFTTTWKHHQLLGILLAIPAAWLTLALAVMAVQVAVQLGSKRLWPPVDVPPPPEQPPAMAEFVEPPRLVYPHIAQAKGQCGWLKFGMQVDRRGRIHSVQVIDQAPGRVFEHAVMRSLFTARLPPHPDAEPLREMTTVVIFLTPSEAAPEWARSRMAATASPEPPVTDVEVSQA